MTWFPSSKLVWLAALCCACSIFDSPAPPKDSGRGPDMEADADTDADTDSDTDADMDCANEPPVTVPIADCVTDFIGCDESVIATTKGGISYFDDEAYIDYACEWSLDGAYDGSEFVFLFSDSGPKIVTVDLHAPCGDLDLFTLNYKGFETDGSCPSGGSYSCEFDDTSRSDSGEDASIRIDLVGDSDDDYMIIVEGPSSDEELFELTVTCEE